MIRVVLIFVLLSASQSLKADEDKALDIVREQWALRGSVAELTLNDLTIELMALKMPHGSRDQDEATKRRIDAQTALEGAYSLHKQRPESVQEEVDGEQVFHLILNAAERGLFDMAYIYSDTGALLSSRIEHLPTGWSVRLPTKDYPIMFVTTHIDDVYTFNLEKPFEALYWGK